MSPELADEKQTRSIARAFGFSNPAPCSLSATLLSCCWSPLVSTCRTRPSSTSRPRAKPRPRTSSRRQPSRPPPSRARPRPTVPPAPRGEAREEGCNTARTRGPPTRNLGSDLPGPPQAQGCYSQSTRLVGLCCAEGVPAV